MKRTKRFDNAFTKLVTAYFKGDLLSGSAQYCAVGNITGSGDWVNPVIHYRETKRIIQSFRDFKGVVAIFKTGYSVADMSKVEWAFEKAAAVSRYNHVGRHLAGGGSIESYMYTEKSPDYQYDGLLAVIDALCEIDGLPTEVAAQSKELLTLQAA